MLYTCSRPHFHGAHCLGPDHGHGVASAAERGTVRRRGKTLTVDIHCHYHNYPIDEKYHHLDHSKIPYRNAFTADDTKRINAKQEEDIIPQMYDIDVRLGIMDRMGIDIQAVAPATEQFYYWTEPEIGRQIAREVNDGLAELVAKKPDRFVGLGTLPLQHPEFAIAELNRLVNELGLRGVEICSHINGLDLTDKSLGLEPVFARIEELGVLIFMHPRPFNGGKRLADNHFSNLIGQPLDSTVAVTHLIFDGVFERHPGLKFCVAHSGGYLPYYHGRMDHGYSVREDCKGQMKAPPSTYLKKLYFDCMTFDPGMLRYMVDRYGADHILLGTDYPYDMGLADPIGLIDSVPKLSKADRDRIKGGNAAVLLGIKS